MSDFNYYEMNLTNHLANHETRNEYFKIDKSDELSDKLRLHKHDVVSINSYVAPDVEELAISIMQGLSKQCESVYINLKHNNLRIENMLIANKLRKNISSIDEEDRKKYFLLYKTRKPIRIVNECNIDKIIEFLKFDVNKTNNTIAVFIDGIREVTVRDCELESKLRKIKEFASRSNVIFFLLSQQINNYAEDLYYKETKGTNIYDNYMINEERMKITNYCNKVMYFYCERKEEEMEYWVNIVKNNDTGVFSGDISVNYCNPKTYEK